MDGDHTLQWYFDEAGLTVDVDAYIPSIEGWGFSAVVIPTDAVKAYLGIDDIETLFDPTYFYGINPDDSKVDYGDNHDVWSSYKPGMWVGEDGMQSGSGGVMFWQYQFGDHKYDGHFTEGLMVIGTNPGNVANVAGKTVTSRAKMGEKLLTVNVTFHAEYPTAKTGKVGPHSYSWTLGDDGVEIVATASAAAKDDSYAWMGFFVNENYINAKYK